MALAMALTRVIFSLPNMSLITLALRNEEEPKAIQTLPLQTNFFVDFFLENWVVSS